MVDRLPELTCFKAYDIRGRVPDELNLELARQIGLAFAAEFSPSTVCIGWDMRLSSEDIAHVVASGLMDGGVDITMIGLCGTEEVYFSTFSQGFDGGIMITASHNPADWNGMKLVRKEARPVSADTGLTAIRSRIETGNLPLAVRRGHSDNRNFRDQFIKHLLSYIDLEKLKPLTLVGNTGNGCAWLAIEALLPYLSCRFIPMNETPDGTFPNGVPNPLLPENREATSHAVIKNKANFGIAWDGDFDRCFFFDEKGNFIESYYIVGLLAESFLANHPGEKILYDPRLTWNTIEIVEQAGGIPIETKSGHAFIKERMRKENALYGGEMSAHHYFRDFSFCDSGMITWLLLYELVSKADKPLSALVEERMARYPVSGEINRAIADPDAAIRRIEEIFAPNAKSITRVDGISIEYPEWRCNIRKSNTEPLLRLNVESRGNAELMKEKTEEILKLMY